MAKILSFGEAFEKKKQKEQKSPMEKEESEKPSSDKSGSSSEIRYLNEKRISNHEGSITPEDNLRSLLEELADLRHGKDSDEKAGAILELMKEKVGGIEKESELYKRMKYMINSIDRFSYSTVNDKRELVRSYSDEELFGWIMNSNEKEWMKMPSFFRAILEEYASRFKY
jgi:hypothetical protein